ncbi:MAG: hypothetical protein Q9221_002576 [Calogaya cf. arnoldii]
MELLGAQKTPRKRRRKTPVSTKPYVFRPLLEDIALAEEGHTARVHITCVELWDVNLYIGTSAAEILHYVAIPPDPNDTTTAPTYIFASRLQPTFNPNAVGSSPPGVQQILVLPKVFKACVLCNGTLTFYSLPELSPAFNTSVPGCSWIGGENMNTLDEQDEDGQTVMICIKSRIRLVRIGNEPRKVRDIEYPSGLAVARRDNFACVADAQAYALLDVENQRKISLFPISSLDENAPGGQVEDISTVREPSRPSSGIVTGHSNAQSSSLKPLPPPPERTIPQQAGQTSPAKFSSKLSPHICSPTPNEFLLTTGTLPEEPGVGMFVNLDGDVVRGTIQFERYPISLLVDVGDLSGTASAGAAQPAGYVLASLIQHRDDGDREVIEVQDISSESHTEYLDIPFPIEADDFDGMKTNVGNAKLRSILSGTSAPFPEVGDRLHKVRLDLPPSSPVAETDIETTHPAAKTGWEEKRNQEEQAFGRRLGMQSSRILLWSGSSTWWLVRNPLVLRLDGSIDMIVEAMSAGTELAENRDEILRILASIREYEANTETEFLSLEYIRQKSSLILFADALSRDQSKSGSGELQVEDLVNSGLDPRILLSLVPLLREEVVEGPEGIWVHAGLTSTVEHYATLPLATSADDTRQKIPRHAEWMNLVKRYLMAWQQRKGFGSIADEVEVFQSTDAALLHLLLHQDSQNVSKSGIPSASRSELYSLVDTGVDCFQRAITLLERYRRLYVLSRLYQNRKMAGKVLATWQRIIEGEQDAGNELRDGENEVRKYLAKIRDISLIHEYGTWLARRKAGLGVQVFADDSSRVKFAPQEVVELLRDKAPEAVKVYLEHLVFGKKNSRYANNLITYYLDSVLHVLETSEDARSVLAQSYESYRALQPPKPTYRQFIMDNAVPEAWWQDRLRLLELLGGSHGADFSYDLGHILRRIEPYEEGLVPESIILDGRQGRHQQALRLLTHGLGDYHTAVNYCLMGGASIFHPISGSLTPSEASMKEDQAVLFGYLLTEFLRIEDVSNRLERTSELLDRFGSWYDVKDVLNMIPETWSVELVSGFLISAFRRLVHDKNEAMVVKALSGAENLQVAAALVEKCSAIVLPGPIIFPHLDFRMGFSINPSSPSLRFLLAKKLRMFMPTYSSSMYKSIERYVRRGAIKEFVSTNGSSLTSEGMSTLMNIPTNASMAEYQDPLPGTSSNPVLLQQYLPPRCPSESASDPESYARTAATSPTELSDSDLSLPGSLAISLDFDVANRALSQNPVLRGGQAVAMSSTFAKGHQPFEATPSSHGHPEPMSSLRRSIELMGAASHPHDNGRCDKIVHPDTAIHVTTASHHPTATAPHHNPINKSTDVADNRRLVTLSNHRMSTAPTSRRTQSTPSLVRCHTTGSTSENHRPASRTTLANDATAAANLNASMGTPLRQAHLNTLLASLIPSAPSSPRTKDADKPDDDPFDNFNSGSEQEDESDIDFKSASVSPSVHSKSPSPVPTPPESDYEEITREKQPTKEKAQATTPIQKKPRTTRTSGLGDWPIASQARRGSATGTETPDLHHQMARSGSNSKTSWPFSTETSRAADRGVAVSGMPTLTAAGHDHNTSSPSMAISTSRKQRTTGDRSKKRSWDRMLESEAEANREVQMLETIEKEKEVGTMVSTQKGTNSSQAVQKLPVQSHEGGEARNGSGWTLVVEKDRNGRRITTWMLC